jgi:GTP-binding protein
LHIVDVGAEAEALDPVDAIQTVAAELGRYSARLGELPRWLVINKIDLIPPDRRDERIDEIVTSLAWKGPVFAVSAATREGTEALCREVSDYLKTLP